MTELSSELLHAEMHTRQHLLRDEARRQRQGVVRDRDRRWALPRFARHSS